MAHIRLEATLETSDKWKITDTSMLHWRRKLKRAAQECDDTLHKCKQRILEDEQMEQRVRNSSFPKRIVHATKLPSHLSPPLLTVTTRGWGDPLFKDLNGLQMVLVSFWDLWSLVAHHAATYHSTPLSITFLQARNYITNSLAQTSILVLNCGWRPLVLQSTEQRLVWFLSRQMILQQWAISTLA